MGSSSNSSGLKLSGRKVEGSTRNGNFSPDWVDDRFGILNNKELDLNIKLIINFILISSRRWSPIHPLLIGVDLSISVVYLWLVEFSALITGQKSDFVRVRSMVGNYENVQEWNSQTMTLSGRANNKLVIFQRTHI